MKHTLTRTDLIKVYLIFVVSALLLAGSFAVNAEENKVERLVAYSEVSVKEGYKIFRMNCTSCHGHDGRARVDFVSDATDLTQPDRWRNGITEADIYTTIKEGAGVDMPPFDYLFSDKKDFWHLINWIASKWSPEQRAALLGKEN